MPFEELSIELTDRCTLNCVYCSSIAGFKGKTFIDFVRIKEIIEEAEENFDINTVSLSGGESFLYPNFWGLYDFLSEKGFNILIYTSGIILDEQGKRTSIPTNLLEGLHVGKGDPKLILNIQGHNKELIESINGVNGSFELIERTIDKIVAEGLTLGAHVVPFKHNYKYLKEIVNFCRMKSFDELKFLRFVPQGRGDFSLWNSKSEFLEIIETIKSILEENMKFGGSFEIKLGHPINFLFLMGSKELYDIEESHHCRAGVDAPLILPNGNVVICPAWKGLGNQFVAGNIYKQDFSSIWNCELFETLRWFIEEGYKNLKKPCLNCIYIDECRGKCVAQRLLAQKENLKNKSIKDIKELVLIGPDSQCFKQLMEGDNASK